MVFLTKPSLIEIGMILVSFFTLTSLNLICLVIIILVHRTYFFGLFSKIYEWLAENVLNYL